jgi:hypothetical protein
MAEFNGQQITTFKSGSTPKTGTLATGTIFENEFNRLYGNDNSLNDSKFDKSGGTISGDTTIKGNLIVEGISAKIQATDMEITDRIITLNKGEAGAGVTSRYAGLEIDRGPSLEKFNILFDETLDRAVAGTAGALKTLALAEEVAAARTETDECLTPVGSIVSYLPGYFTNGANGGYAGLGLTLSGRWKVCDGSACNDTESPIFNGNGRYLPNLTDNRFLMGSNTPGGIGGQNSYTISTGNLPPHTHVITHDHGDHTHTGTTGTVSSNHQHFLDITSSTNGSHQHDIIMSSGHSGSFAVAIGGDSTQQSGRVVASGNHNHATSGWTGGFSADHTHDFTTKSTGISYTGSSENGGFANSAIENRPLYLSCKYIIRIK